jgi:hypothetical protein
MDFDWFVTLGNQETDYRTLFLLRGCFRYSSHLCTLCWRRESPVVSKCWSLGVPTAAHSGVSIFFLFGLIKFFIWLTFVAATSLVCAEHGYLTADWLTAVISIGKLSVLHVPEPSRLTRLRRPPRGLADTPERTGVLGISKEQKPRT